MKKIIIFGLFCVSLMVLGCGDSGKPVKTADNGNDSGREIGSLYGECYPNETCNKGLECDVENNICLKESENSENPDNTDTTSENKEDKTDTDSEISDNENDSTTGSMSDDETDTSDTSDTEDSTNNDDDAINDDDNGCTTGAYKCKGSNSYSCKDNLLNLEEYCEYGCDSSTGKCKTAECSGEEYTCYSDSQSQYCNNGHWSYKSCEGGCNSSTGKCKDICYNITGKIWSQKANEKKNWENALDYCDKLTACGYSDWHLPTISELRTLIQNCPDTETGGECGVTDTCLSSLNEDTCYNEACINGCYSANSSNQYNKFGNIGLFWSSSVPPAVSSVAWGVNFYYNSVSVTTAPMSVSYDVRCVRNVD